MINTEKFYTCKSDRAFKEVFMKEESKDVLAKVLETVLKVEIKDINLIEIAKNMLKENMDINLIFKLTGLTIEEIKSLDK